MLMAFLGHFLGINPLCFYQVVGHALAAFSIPFVFYWCVRCFGMSRWLAACGAICAIIFLLIDTAGPASYGNTAFGHMWHGKAIVWILFLPVALVLTYRFISVGKAADIFWLTSLAIAGVGFSNSSLYLLPATIGCVSIAFVLTEFVSHIEWKNAWRSIQRCLWLALPCAYPIGILLLLALNVIPKPVDTQGFGGANYIPWNQGIDYVVGHGPQHLRNVALMLLIPAPIIGGRKGLFFLVYVGLVWLLCLNPLLAHRWMKNIFAVCYFRLNYLLPLPLLCAMVATVVRKWISTPSRFLPERVLPGIAIGAVISVLFYSSRSLVILPRSEQLGWKSPLDLQLQRPNVEFAKAAKPYLEHSKLLAPGWTASCELPLLFPDMKVVAPRLVMHYFANAGKKEEGSIRRMAQAFVETDPATRTTARRAADERAAFDAIVTSGKANAIAVPKAQSARVEAELQAIDSRWHKAVEAGGLDLFVPS
jgi:hypothetical protein